MSEKKELFARFSKDDIDTSGLDEVLTKLHQIIDLLKEINELSGSLEKLKSYLR